ncbi:MAG: protein-disulfide reductase DsbD family protein [Sedimentisphaerales bacterium]|nr:protein-disulfide reductase DsbD family protein [Sedimentisphaerales bacterium]
MMKRNNFCLLTLIFVTVLALNDNSREQPHKDDKILTSWNGLMISSLAFAGRNLEEPRYTAAAVKAANLVLNNLVDDHNRLLRTYRAGQAKLGGYLDDYAYFAEGLIELYAATGKQRWLEQAEQLTDIMLAEFEDKQAGGFFFTAAFGEDILTRSKNLSGGGNIPAANGKAVLVLLELNRLTGKKEYLQSARRTLESLTPLMWQSPRSLDSGIYAAAAYLQHKAAEKLQTGKIENADATKEFGPVTAHLFSSRQSIKPGQIFHLAAALDIAEGWHLYGPNPEIGFLIPADVSVSANNAFTIGNISKPLPQKKLDPVLKQTLTTYEGRICYYIPVTIKENVQDGQTTVKIQVKTQACDQNTCLAPRTDEIAFTIDIASNADEGKLRHTEVFESIEKEKH